MPEAFNTAIATDGLTEAERGRILDADMVLQATQGSTGQRVYAAVEASFTVNESDVDRAPAHRRHPRPGIPERPDGGGSVRRGVP